MIRVSNKRQEVRKSIRKCFFLWVLTRVPDPGVLIGFSFKWVGSGSESGFQPMVGSDSGLQNMVRYGSGVKKEFGSGSGLKVNSYNPPKIAAFVEYVQKVVTHFL